MRLLWRLTTPRRLRRNTLIILLAWTAVAFANQNGMIPDGSSLGPVGRAPHTPVGLQDPESAEHPGGRFPSRTERTQ